jgi:hypothetical protein
MDANQAVKARAVARAKFCAWTVAISMAATTMTFQVYHSIRFGQMPVPLAVLEGVVPLLISMCILEFVSKWEGARWWAVTAAYLIMGGSMYLSAAATGAVVLHATPGHMAWLFGVLLDAAALLAVHFILNGPTAADVSRHAAAEETARAGREASLLSEIGALKQARDARASALRAELDAANDARTEAERVRADAEANAANLARKLETHARAKGARTKGASGRRKNAGGKVPNDVDARTEALKILDERPDISGADLGEECGMSKRWGQLRKQEYAGLVSEGTEAE